MCGPSAAVPTSEGKGAARAADMPAATAAAAPPSNTRPAKLTCAVCNQCSKSTKNRLFLDCTDPTCGMKVRTTNYALYDITPRAHSINRGRFSG